MAEFGRSAAEAFAAARMVTDRQTTTLNQAVLADFIHEGHFLRHIRRMRTLYSERQEILLKTAQRDLGGLLEVCPCETGLHLIGWLPVGRGDQEMSQAALRAGVEAPPLSTNCVERPQRGGLMLGYAGSEARQIRDAVRRLGAAFRENL